MDKCKNWPGKKARVGGCKGRPPPRTNRIALCKCIECGGIASPVSGAKIYPHIPEYHSKRFYLCKCGAYVGSHDSDGRPLGYAANSATRRARREAHLAFDPLWRGRYRSKRRNQMSREEAYNWLARQLGIPRSECHIGMMTKDMAIKVVEAVKKLEAKE